MTLGEYLELCAPKRRRAGVHDCVTFPADWAVACGRPDPMAKWRGTYSTERQAEDLIYDAGSLAALFAQGMAAAGIPTASDTSAGCIGIVSLMGEEAGAIFTGKRWALVADRGLAFASIEPELIVARWLP